MNPLYALGLAFLGQQGVSAAIGGWTKYLDIKDRKELRGRQSRQDLEIKRANAQIRDQDADAGLNSVISAGKMAPLEFALSEAGSPTVEDAATLEGMGLPGAANAAVSKLGMMPQMSAYLTDQAVGLNGVASLYDLLGVPMPMGTD